VAFQFGPAVLMDSIRKKQIASLLEGNLDGQLPTSQTRSTLIRNFNAIILSGMLHLVTHDYVP
jgi:hypothetical protein